MPPKSAKGLLGRRVDAKRAGINMVKPMGRLQPKFGVVQDTCFAFQQNGYAVTHGVREASTAGDKLLRIAVVFQRPLGYGANNQFE